MEVAGIVALVGSSLLTTGLYVYFRRRKQSVQSGHRSGAPLGHRCRDCVANPEAHIHGMNTGEGDRYGIYFDGGDPGRLILWETETVDGLEFEIGDGTDTVVLFLNWHEIERLEHGLAGLFRSGR